MVGPLPRGYFILFWIDFHPFFTLPIQNADGVETLFIGTSSSEDDNLVVFFIVIHRTVGSLGGNIACGFDLSPFHCYGIEGPKVVHVVGVGITSEKDDVFSDDAAAVSPAWGGPMRRG